MISKEFENKNYLLMGAAHGLGETLAYDLTQCRANLFLVDIDKKLKDLCKILSKKTRCAGLVCDLTDYDKVVDRLLSVIGKEGLDGIVYFTRGRQKYSYDQLDEKKWKDDFRLNVESLMHIVHRLWTKKKINKNASIILLSSLYAKYVGIESLSYNMSKSALESMCRYLAAEMGPSNIRVNTLQLGFIVKDAYKRNFYSEDNKEYRFWAQRVHPLRRVGHNMDVIGPIKFFLSGESSFITGQILCIDGGMTIQEPSILARDFVVAQKKAGNTKR